MPISFALSNFKGFKELNLVDIQPLTVICGTNNSGKSSLLQSLLLMKQSNLDNTKITPSNNIQEQLVFNGKYTRLGSYLDVLHSHSYQGEMIFLWKIVEEMQTVKNVTDRKILDSEILIKIKGVEHEKLHNLSVINDFCYKNMKTNFSFELTNIREDRYKLKLKNISYGEFILRWVYEPLRLKSFSTIEEFIKKFFSTKFSQNAKIAEFSFKDVQVKFDGVFPRQVVIKDFPQQSLVVLDQISKSLDSMSKIKIPDSLREIFKIKTLDLNNFIQKRRSKNDENLVDYISEDVDEISESKDKHFQYSDNQKISLLNNYHYYRETVFYLKELWSSIRYIRPIREAPKRFYLFDDLTKIDIGINGEYTPLVLAVEQDMNIPKYYRCIYAGKHISQYEMREQDKLLEGVNWWLFDFMKLPKIYSADGLRGAVNQVKLNSSGVDVDLPDVGFGVSQILPILVECLRTDTGETIILEQPEIHLHPSLQSKLADFFISMAKAGKNLVIETHSEHLINRLCLRIAQEESQEIKNLTNILFVSFDEQNKTSVCKPIEINQYGEIENWPVGFFDENDSRDMLAATLKKRMSNQTKNEELS